jgi:hypothetical protein
VNPRRRTRLIMWGSQPTSSKSRTEELAFERDAARDCAAQAIACFPRVPERRRTRADDRPDQRTE